MKKKLLTYNVDPIVPTTYIEKPPFPFRIKEHAKASAVVRKSYTRTPTPPERIKVEPSVAMVKDLLADNIDGHVIYFCDETARIAKPCARDKHRPVVGVPVISVKIGDHCCMACVIWVLVLVQYLLTYIKKLCMILHPLS